MTLPVGYLNPKSTQNSTFCFGFHFFVMGEYRDLKFGVEVDHSKSQPMNDKLPMKGVWSRHVNHFRFLVPLKYLGNGLS